MKLKTFLQFTKNIESNQQYSEYSVMYEIISITQNYKAIKMKNFKITIKLAYWKKNT